MAWVESAAQGFVARHDSADAKGAGRVLETLIEARPRIEAVLGPTIDDEVTVVIHGSEWALTLAEPVLPLVR